MGHDEFASLHEVSPKRLALDICVFERLSSAVCGAICVRVNVQALPMMCRDDKCDFSKKGGAGANRLWMNDGKGSSRKSEDVRWLENNAAAEQIVNPKISAGNDRTTASGNCTIVNRRHVLPFGWQKNERILRQIILLVNRK